MSAMRARQFRLAVERQDRAAITESFADGFVQLSPATSRPFKGRTLGSGLVHAARSVLEDLHCTHLGGPIIKIVEYQETLACRHAHACGRVRRSGAGSGTLFRD